MRVLILTAGYGEGHNSAARALQAAFNEHDDVEAELVDLFALRAPRLDRISRRGYLNLINTAPRIWSRVYRWLDTSPLAPAMFSALGSHRRLLRSIILARQPAAIVCTYPVYGWLLNQLRRDGFCCCPHYTVVTDALTINSLWYRTPSAGWFVTDEDSAAFLHQRGLPRVHIHVSGFPVGLAFADRPAHLIPPPPTDPRGGRRILFMINSNRRTALPVARELLRHRDWQVTFTAGRDQRLQSELASLARGANASAEILGWTHRIPELLMTHHVVISKAGGATTQEAINALCPMVVSQIVPGQEEGNFELLRRNAAGAHASSPQDIASTIRRAFANDAAGWREWRHNLRRIARPSAARTISDRVLAECAPTALVAPRKPYDAGAGTSRKPPVGSAFQG